MQKIIVFPMQKVGNAGYQTKTLSADYKQEYKKYTESKHNFQNHLLYSPEMTPVIL
jgi:hypothetical protein